MFSIWVLMYIVPLTILWISSIWFQQKDYILITSVSMGAFVVTRMITTFIDGERYMFDLSNDLAVVVILLYYLKNNLVVRALTVSYALMTLISYLPYANNLVNNEWRYLSLEIIGKIQLVIITWGMIHGFLSRTRNTLKHADYGFRSLSISDCGQPTRFVETWEHGNYQKIPIFIKKNGKKIVCYVDTTPYRSPV